MNGQNENVLFVSRTLEESHTALSVIGDIPGSEVNTPGTQILLGVRDHLQ